MNQIIQDNSIAIIGFLILIIFLLMGVMIYMLYRLLTSSRSMEALPSQKAPLIESAPEQTKYPHLKRPDHVAEKFHCHNHPDEPSVASCLICEEVFCENCLVEHESMHFCKDHFRVFANSKWHQITDVRTTPDTPEEGLFVYNFKRDLWREKSIPAFVMTHYKINIDNDYIESFVQLNVREEDVENLAKEIERYKHLEIK